MIRNVTVNEIFPTPLWIVDLEADKASVFNQMLADEIDRLPSPRVDRGPGTPWQTHQNLHALPSFKPFVDLVMNAAGGALQFLEVDFDRVEITGCWANINPIGTQHRMHHHPNNFLSGVYYVRSGGKGGEIEFSDPRPGAEIMMPPVKSNTRFNRNIVSAEPFEGRLVMFPSYLKHSVNVNKHDSERISIAFNLMFPDLGTRMAAPLWEATVDSNPA